MKIKIVIALVAALVVGLFAWLLLGEKSRTEALTAELNQARTEAGRADQDRTALQTEAQSLRSENEALLKEKQELRNLLAGTESDLTSTRRELSELQSQTAEMRAGQDQARAEAAKRLKEIETAKADVKRAQAEAENLKKTLQTAQADLKRAQAEAENLKKAAAAGQAAAELRAGLEKESQALLEKLDRLQAGASLSGRVPAPPDPAAPAAAQAAEPGLAEGSWAGRAGQPGVTAPGASAEAVPRTGAVSRMYSEAPAADADRPESRTDDPRAGQPGVTAEAVPRTDAVSRMYSEAPAADADRPESRTDDPRAGQPGVTAPGASAEAVPRTDATRLAGVSASEPTETDRAEYERLQLAVAQAEAEAKTLKDQLERAQNLLSGLRRDRDRLAGETQAARAEVKSTQADYDRLVTDLRAQIDSRELVISQLRDELSLTFLDSVFFAPAQASVTPDGARVLDALAKALHGRTDERIVVVGHTDDLPIAKRYRKVFPTNWELSSARAVAVLRYLTEKGGLDPTDLTAVGRSFHQPVAPNDSDANRQKNRRVEIIISKRPAPAR